MTGRVGGAEAGATGRACAAGRLYSVRGTAGSGAKPTSASSPASCSAVRKHCGWPENWVKTNGSPATGAVAAGKGVAGEGEDEERGAGSRDPRGLAQPRRGTRPPSAPGSRCRARSRSRSSRRPPAGDPWRRAPVGVRPAARRACRCELGQRRASAGSCRARRRSSRGRPVARRSVPRRSRGRAPGGGAPPTRPSAAAPLSANRIRTWFGAELAKPATTDGALQGEPAGEVMPVT